MKKWIIISIIMFSVTGTSLFFALNEAKNERESEGKYLSLETENDTQEVFAYSAYGDILKNLKSKYPDICGWINVEKTKISYPILQSTDNEYYVRRAYDGTKDKNGSIIADYRLDRSLSTNQNIVLYGHNLASGNMFSYLSDPEKFIEANIEIYSEGVLAVYKPYAAYIADNADFIKLEFESEDSLKNYITAGKNKSIIDFKINPENGTHLLTMVTCENSFMLGEKRIVIHAVRTDLITP